MKQCSGERLEESELLLISCSVRMGKRLQPPYRYHRCNEQVGNGSCHGCNRNLHLGSNKHTADLTRACHIVAVPAAKAPLVVTMKVTEVTEITRLLLVLDEAALFSKVS